MNVSQLFDASSSWPAPPATPASPDPAAPAARPEDSAQFSLEHLVEATASPAAPATPAGSGIIDLSSMKTALHNAPARPISPWIDPAHRLLPPDPPPSNGWLDRLSTPVPPPSMGVGWLYGVIGLLSGALVMLLVGMIWKTAETSGPAAAAELALAGGDWDQGGGEYSYVVIPSAGAEPDAEPEPEPEPEPATVRTRKPKPRATKPRPKPRSSPRSTPKPAAKPKPGSPTPAKAPTPSDLSVDCILNPASCGRGTTKKPTTPTTKPAEALPTKLSSTQIKSALAGPKNDARACREMHGAAAGTKVTVRLSIDGKTGRVTSAKAQAPHANALGSCVASKLSGAKFPRFSNRAMGVVYSVRM